MSRGTCSLRVASQELSCPFSVKTFAAVFPDPTDRPWLSEDVIKRAKGRTIRKVMGGGEGAKYQKNSCKGKLSEKKFMYAE